MGNLFDGLENLGIGGLSKLKVFEDIEKEEKEKAEVKKKVAAEPKEEDFLIDKKYICPVCDFQFTSRTVLTTKLKSIGSDEDLRPHYNYCDVLKYDAITCSKCGYSALLRYFPTALSQTQRKLLNDNIRMSFTGINQSTNIIDYDEAITKHRLALACSIVKHSKPSERAFICLKTAWLLRGKRESMGDALFLNGQKNNLLAQEKEFLENAYEGFNDAFTKEPFPMCGMDETTLTYLLAVLAYELEKYDDALRTLGRVIQSRTASERIKDKARDIKDKIINSGHKEAE